MTRDGPIFGPRSIIGTNLEGPLGYATYQISIKALGLVVSDKKIFSCFPYISLCKHVTPGGPIFGPSGIFGTNLEEVH